MKTSLEAVVLTPEIQNKTTDNNEIGGSAAQTDAMTGLTKGHIQHPMQLILNGTMTTNVAQMKPGILRQTGFEI